VNIALFFLEGPVIRGIENSKQHDNAKQTENDHPPFELTTPNRHIVHERKEQCGRYHKRGNPECNVAHLLLIVSVSMQAARGKLTTYYTAAPEKCGFASLNAHYAPKVRYFRVLYRSGAERYNTRISGFYRT
jgi:hypothetical protein